MYPVTDWLDIPNIVYEDESEEVDTQQEKKHCIKLEFASKDDFYFCNDYLKKLKIKYNCNSDADAIKELFNEIDTI
jgi:hypothetical protein